jgi:hypothetical protein
MASPVRRLVGFLLFVTLLGVAGAARAQAPGRASAPDLNTLALEWALGQYGSPFVCQLNGAPVRAVRRVAITPAPSDRGPMGRIQFPDPEAAGATRCFSELGGDEPLVDGSVTFSLPGSSRADFARHDFADTLRRDDGFRFDIRAGTLSVKGWGPGNDAPKEVSFAGGHATLHALKPGTDGERLLRGFESPRKLSLELEAPDGTILRFPLFQVPDR